MNKEIKITEKGKKEAYVRENRNSLIVIFKIDF